MKLKEGRKEAWEETVKEAEKTPRGRKELRFVMQWVTAMEMETENGRDIISCAKKTLANTSHSFVGAGCSLDEWKSVLKDNWLFGDDLEAWFKKGGPKIDTFYSDNAGDDITKAGIYISQHASKRLHERLGLGKKAGRKKAAKALKEGLTIEQTKGVTRSYLSHVFYYTEGDNGDIPVIRLLDRSVFIYKKSGDRIVLVTVMNLPKNCGDQQELEVS